MFVVICIEIGFPNVCGFGTVKIKSRRLPGVLNLFSGVSLMHQYILMEVDVLCILQRAYVLGRCKDDRHLLSTKELCGVFFAWKFRPVALIRGDQANIFCLHGIP